MKTTADHISKQANEQRSLSGRSWPLSYFFSKAKDETKEMVVFLVDDDVLFLKAMEHSIVNSLPSIKVKIFQTGEACLQQMKMRPSIVILDYYLSAEVPYAWNGISILNQIKKINSKTKVIMVSSQDSLNIAIKCMEKGAYDYISKSKAPLAKINQIVKRNFENRETDNFVFRFYQLLFIIFIITILLFLFT